ncbi:ATPase [Salinimicrobium marinum]|uniref:ATPase n=1 Tax=Salinimicrobium marinum TaxID=680283 RepID=A0A918SC81_9FLAO|nr:ATPase [Salinimicrobium marinum]GHA32920.1 ATPase [Salinimicrobium marinum]
MINPCEIMEGDVTFSLGNLKKKEVHYDFSKILIYLDAKGKILFGKKFRLHEEDRETLFKLSIYFIQDKEKCEALGIDPQKGILLNGPVGCGKSSLMKLLKFIVPHHRPYEVMSTRNIAFAFNHLGFKTIEDYGNSGYFCFDDLGIEPEGRYNANDCNVMGEILLSRYELFLRHKTKTHVTTNLNSDELEDCYGARVRSRMRHLFNLIAFAPDSRDKRK